MRRMIAFTCAMTLLLAPFSFAQPDPNAPGGQPPPAPPAPATRLESLLYIRDVVVTKGYTDVATIDSGTGSSVRITAVELVDAQRGGKERGLAITINDSANQAVSYVDFDEIDQLLAALETLAKQDTASVTMDHFDIEYRTKGDLQIGNIERERVRYLQVRGIQFHPTGQIVQASGFFAINNLPEMHRHIAAAKQLLEAAQKKG